MNSKKYLHDIYFVSDHHTTYYGHGDFETIIAVIEFYTQLHKSYQLYDSHLYISTYLGQWHLKVKSL